jgi:hypothetical protein
MTPLLLIYDALFAISLSEQSGSLASFYDGYHTSPPTREAAGRAMDAIESEISLVCGVRHFLCYEQFRSSP